MLCCELSFGIKLVSSDFSLWLSECSHSKLLHAEFLQQCLACGKCLMSFTIPIITAMITKVFWKHSKKFHCDPTCLELWRLPSLSVHLFFEEKQK